MNNRRRPRPDMGAVVADEGLKPMNIVDRIGQKQMKKSLEIQVLKKIKRKKISQLKTS